MADLALPEQSRRARPWLHRAAWLLPVAAFLLAAGRSVWDGAAAHCFAGIAARVAGLREAARHRAALDFLASQAGRFPGSRLAEAVGLLEEDTLRQILESERRRLREAAGLDAGGDAGEAFRLYGEIERASAVPILSDLSTLARSGITSRRESAEAWLNQARRLESAGYLEAAARVYRRVLRDYPASSAVRAIRIPLYVITEPSGARLEVLGQAWISPAWISWPLRRGVRLRVSSEGFQPLELGPLVLPGEEGLPEESAAPLRVRLEPERVWQAAMIGGSIAGGDLDPAAPVAVIGADGVVRGLHLEKDAGARVLWEAPLGGPGAPPPAAARAWVSNGAVLVAAAGGPLRGFELGGGRELESGDPRLSLALRVFSPAPEALAEGRAAAGQSAIFVLLAGGRLQRWDPPGLAPAFQADLGGDLDRVSFGPAGVLVSGKERLILCDPASGGKLREATAGLPSSDGRLEAVLGAGWGEGGEGAGPLLVLARNKGQVILLSVLPNGQVCWSYPTGAAWGLSARPFEDLHGRQRLLLTAPGCGVQLIGWR